MAQPEERMRMELLSILTALAPFQGRKPDLSALLFAALLPLLSGGNALAQGNVATTDREALVALYDATDGSNWTTSTNWKTTAPLKDWSGVTAPAGDSVIVLSLIYNNLTGSIPAQLGNLTNLWILNLAHNQLIGSIPATLGDLTNLTSLQLADNQLSGSIPATLGDLTNLTGLQLADNQLSGSIPATLGDLTNLTGLWLFSNQLSGSIPATLGDLTNLTSLQLADNQLSGSIPATPRGPHQSDQSAASRQSVERLDSRHPRGLDQPDRPVAL